MKSSLLFREIGQRWRGERDRARLRLYEPCRDDPLNNVTLPPRCLFKPFLGTPSPALFVVGYFSLPFRPPRFVKSSPQHRVCRQGKMVHPMRMARQCMYKGSQNRVIDADELVMRRCVDEACPSASPPYAADTGLMREDVLRPPCVDDPDANRAVLAGTCEARAIISPLGSRRENGRGQLWTGRKQ